MLESFAPFLRIVVPGITGGLTGATLLYLIFALIDADKGERLGIFVKTIIALIVMNVLAVIVTLTFSFIALISIVIVALWLYGSYN